MALRGGAPDPCPRQRTGRPGKRRHPVGCSAPGASPRRLPLAYRPRQARSADLETRDLGSRPNLRSRTPRFTLRLRFAGFLRRLCRLPSCLQSCHGVLTPWPRRPVPPAACVLRTLPKPRTGPAAPLAPRARQPESVRLPASPASVRPIHRSAGLRGFTRSCWPNTPRPVALWSIAVPLNYWWRPFFRPNAPTCA